MKNLYLVVGKSGSGKSAIVEAYCKKYRTTQVLSYTTRPMRPSEVRNPTHVHISVEEFNLMKDDMVAYTFFNGHHYGVTKALCVASDFYVIDKYGIEYFQQRCKDVPYKIIKVEVIDSILYARLCERDGKEKALERIAHDKAISYDITYDYVIDNNRVGNLEGVVEELHHYIESVEKEG